MAAMLQLSMELVPNSLGSQGCLAGDGEKEKKATRNYIYTHIYIYIDFLGKLSIYLGKLYLSIYLYISG